MVLLGRARLWIVRGWRAPVAVLFVVAAVSGIVACGRVQDRVGESAREQPSILLVTLDTTRADSIGPDARGVRTPSFNAVAGRGRRFTRAFATVPETLPSHGSMMTGLYAAGHGIHENARYLPEHVPVLAERLGQAGYRTAAFVSSFVLARRFGLARGFATYDDALPDGQAERSSRLTTDRALEYLAAPPEQPLFLWVHYFDPHAPYLPPEPFRSAHAARPYLGEVAAMDQQLGRLIEAFEQRVRAAPAVIVVSDHGEGLGDHGELQHGNLLYQSTMHVPLLVVGPGVSAGVIDTPVSTRRVFHTVLDFAGLDATDSLRGELSGRQEVVAGEAMKPFLEYGWQPQIMAVAGRQKGILAGKLEVYDLVDDPDEARDLGAGANLPSALRTVLDEYPIPAPEAARAPDNLSEDARRQLASLGYVSGGAAPPVRKDAPRPSDMVHLFDLMERASTLFVQEKYKEVVPLLERILKEDAHNLDALLRLATAHSMLGQDAAALAAFKRAADAAPQSSDVRTYLALHYARGREWQRAVPMLEQIVAQTPERLTAVEALADVRERQGRVQEAISLRLKVYGSRPPTAAESLHLGRLAMSVQQTALAIESFEAARRSQGNGFRHDLELGALYLAARRFGEARDALDRVPSSHPEYPMALFKRAQVSVLLNEPDLAERIALARKRADATTRPLIASEKLFRQ